MMAKLLRHILMDRWTVYDMKCPLQSRMLLQPEFVLEDVSQDHARKTVS